MKFHHRLNPQRGFTLIEVLIAMIVFSIGLLGLAGLQAAGLRNNTSSYLRSQATFLAYDMADRIRANRRDAINSDYDIDLKDSAAGSGIVVQDQQEWKALLRDRLPAGDGAVNSTQIGTKTVFTITVEWDDSRGEEPPQTFSFNTEL